MLCVKFDTLADGILMILMKRIFIAAFLIIFALYWYFA